jgi:hypothetical protein
MNPRFPLVLDNTQLTTARACKRKFYFEYCLGLSPAGESIDLTAGRAFAAACEETRNAFYLHNEDEQTAVARGLLKLGRVFDNAEVPPHKEQKSFPRLVDAFLAYFGLEEVSSPRGNPTINGVHRLGQDPYTPVEFPGGNGVEFSVSIPTGFEHPDGQELLFHGRFDSLANSSIGMVGLDEKTGSSMDKNWAEKWGLRSQFLNYMHISREFGYPLSAFVTRGVILQKTQFHFPEAIIQPTESTISQCWDSTMYETQLVLSHWGQSYWPGAFNDACNAFGGCPFRTICESGGDPEPWTDQFNIAFWDPVKGEREVIHEVRSEGEVDNPLGELS